MCSDRPDEELMNITDQFSDLSVSCILENQCEPQSPLATSVFVNRFNCWSVLFQTAFQLSPYHTTQERREQAAAGMPASLELPLKPADPDHTSTTARHVCISSSEHPPSSTSSTQVELQFLIFQCFSLLLFIVVWSTWVRGSYTEFQCVLKLQCDDVTSLKIDSRE